MTSNFRGGKYLKIMALDVGDRTIGIAISDATKMIAQGIEVIRRVGNVKDLARLAELISEYDVSEIVVSYPKNMNGSIGERCVIVEKSLTDKLVYCRFLRIYVINIKDFVSF